MRPELGQRSPLYTPVRVAAGSSPFTLRLPVALLSQASKSLAVGLIAVSGQFFSRPLVQTPAADWLSWNAGTCVVEVCVSCVRKYLHLAPKLSLGSSITYILQQFQFHCRLHLTLADS
jgi:hypothetical protein